MARGPVCGRTSGPRVFWGPDRRSAGESGVSFGAERSSRVTDQSSRDVLPIADRPYEGELPLDAKDPEATFPPIEPLRPPDGAPNVLVVLLDDVGFGASSAFGGPCAPPTAERLAANGLRYNRFHT